VADEESGMKTSTPPQLPHSIESEQSVLGGLMIGFDVLHEVIDQISEQDFFRKDHQLIYRSICELAAKGTPYDAVTMGDWFTSQGLGEMVEGGAYLTELATTTPSAANLRAYAEKVREKAMQRKLIDIGQKLTQEAWSHGEPLEVIGNAQSAMGALLDHLPCELEPIHPVLTRVFDTLMERAQSAQDGTSIHGLTTGIEELDNLLGGMVTGGLYVLAARPKMGKTTLAQNIAAHCALERERPVAFFSFEMQPEELGQRLLSSIGGIDGQRLRGGDFDDEHWPKLNEAVRRIKRAPLFISRPRQARVEHVIAQVRRQHARQKLGLVVIDYLQLMHTRGDNRAQAIGDITRALKLMAGELKLPVLLLSQLNREVEKRPDKHPHVADLRDSGSIEQDADAVIFIYRDEVYNTDSRWRGSAELIVAISRNGPTGDVRVQYQPHLFRFQSLPEGWMPAPLPESGSPSHQRRFGQKRTFKTSIDARQAA